ncbi:hypothetical protein [Clostridium manihotivorum]|nr:hypothetical protein [Clostridium manihotivorum]
MGTKISNTRKKMASLGLKKNEYGDYVYIDPNDRLSEFVAVKGKKKEK